MKFRIVRLAPKQFAAYVKAEDSSAWSPVSLSLFETAEAAEKSCVSFKKEYKDRIVKEFEL